MENIGKPLTKNLKRRANELFKYMKAKGGYVSKEEICRVLDLNNERSAREVVSALATVRPIISTSDNKGYKLAMTAADIEEVRHCWQELDSRQAELDKRKKPLIKFYETIKENERKRERI